MMIRVLTFVGFLCCAMVVAIAYYLGIKNNLETLTKSIEVITGRAILDSGVVDSTIEELPEQEEVYYYPQVPKEQEHSTYE